MNKRKFAPAALVLSALAIPVLTEGCSSDASNPLCCTEFKVGATINADIGGSAESKVAVQAVADIGGIASAMVDDLITSCRSIAQDLGAPQADQDAAEAKTDKRERLTAWCTLAVNNIASVKAEIKAQGNATLTVQFDPPKCEASISAAAKCQASCSASGGCDVKANPPKCEGGKLEVSCSGGCTAEAGGSISCEGKCEGQCDGSCTATGGVAVDCNGKCDGTCTAKAGVGDGAGAHADGTCSGTCSGTCTATATMPKVTCTGSCKGQCNAKCSAQGNVSAKCDGKCDAKAEPLSCKGGELKASCQVDAKCDANCNASIQAKAECTPPKISVVVQASGSASAEIQAKIAKLKAVFETNFGVIASFQARLEGVFKATGTLTANIGAVADIKAACIIPLVAATGQAVEDIKSSVTITGNLMATTK